MFKHQPKKNFAARLLNNYKKESCVTFPKRSCHCAITFLAEGLVGVLSDLKSPQPCLPVKAHFTCDQSSPHSHTLLVTSHSALLFMYSTLVLTQEQC